MAKRVFEEESITNKINIGIWSKAFKYVLPKWPLLILILLTMSFTSFYDASFIPSMSAGLINAFSESTFYPNEDILTCILNVKILGIQLSITF